MTEDNPTPFAFDEWSKWPVETIEDLAARLGNRADEITQLRGAPELARDLRYAATSCAKLASLRFEVSAIAGRTTDPDTARELRRALEFHFREPAGSLRGAFAQATPERGE